MAPSSSQRRSGRLMPLRAALAWFRRGLRWVVSLHGRPQNIALGASIGLFVAFTPTIGLQMIIAAFGATLAGASRAAAIVAVWVTNPLTIPPIYAGTYHVGALFWPGRHETSIYERLAELTRTMDRYDFYEVFGRFNQLLGIGFDVLLPMTIGGLIVGLAAAAAAYPVTLWGVRRAHALHHLRRHRRRLRRRSPPPGPGESTTPSDSV